MEEKKEKGRVSSAIRIIIIVLLVIAVGMIYYFQFIVNNRIFEAYEYKFNELQNEIDNIVTKNEGVSVINGYTYVYSGKGDSKFFVKVPKITGNTETIEEINGEIYHESAIMMVSLRNLNIESGILDKGITIDYRFKKVNGNLIVYVYFYPNDGTTKRNARRYW